MAASVCGVLLFTVVTRAATGGWPHWGPYADFIRLYTTGGFGELPIRAWSPGLALGAFVLAAHAPVKAPGARAITAPAPVVPGAGCA